MIEQIRANNLELFTSPELLAEFSGVMSRPKFAAILARTEHTPQRMIEQLNILSETVVAPALNQPVCRDPKDDIVLACALAASAHMVVSGDADLLSLGTFEGIPIITAAQAIAMLETGTR